MAKTWTERGKERGLIKGQRLTLQLLLEEKFGPLSAAVLERLESWPADQLDRLALGFRRAESLRELGLED
jgi:hypothetical protein